METISESSLKKINEKFNNVNVKPIHDPPYSGRE